MKKKIISTILALTMIVGMFPLPVQAEDEPFQGGTDIFSYSKPTELLNNVPDNLYGDIELSSGEYKPHLLVAEHEIVLQQDSNVHGSGAFNSDGRWIFDGDSQNLSLVSSASALKNDSVGSTFGSDPMFLEGVAFDPTGSGRDDHIAYVYVNYYVSPSTGQVDINKPYLVLMVVDAVNNTNVTSVSIGHGATQMQWLNDVPNYSMGNYIDITAGDYDGDGMDTFVVYHPKVNEPSIIEYELDGKTLKQLHSKDVFGDSNPLSAYIKPASGTSVPYNQATISLATGDFNGDGIEDYATAVGTTVINGSEDGVDFTGQNMTADDLKQYVTEISIFENGGALTSVSGGAHTLYSDDANGATGGTDFTMLYQGNIAAGDIDNDGTDEIAVVGYRNKITLNNGEVQNVYDYNGGHFVAGVVDKFAGDSSRSFRMAINSDISDSVSRYQFRMNEFTKDGFYGDDTGGDFQAISPQIAVEIARLDGENSAETIMIAGDIYSLGTGADYLGSAGKPVLNKEYSTSYFSGAINNIHGEPAHHTFVSDIIKGNFDGNDYGREQFYVVAMHVGDGERYSALGGFVGGTYNNEINPATGENLENYVASLTGYYSSSFGHDHDKDTRPLQNALYSGSNAINFVPIAADTDDDGIMVRFSEKTDAVTNPEVVAVLQAAPYFEETAVNGFEPQGSTSYTVSQTYETGFGSADNVSWSIGAATELEVKFLGALTISAQAGYVGSHSSAYEQAFTETHSTTFEATTEDQVVVSTISLVNYVYDVYDENKGWVENGLVINYPLAPSYYQYSIDAYNAMVDVFAQKVATYNSENKNANAKVTIEKIVEGTHIPADNEGNPQAYSNAFTDLATDGKTLSVAGVNMSQSPGSVTSEWSYENSTTNSKVDNHGFELSASIMGGVGVPGNGFLAGVYGGIEYTNERSSYVTTVEAQGASGTVTNITPDDVKGLPQTENLSVGDYHFTWQFGYWDIDLDAIGEDKTPVYGYVTSNVGMPAVAPENFIYSYNSDGDLVLNWDAVVQQGDNASDKNYRPEAKGYNIYNIDRWGSVTKVNATAIDALTYTITGLESEASYSYFVAATYGGSGAVGYPSEILDIVAPTEFHTLSYSVDNPTRATVTGKVGNTNTLPTDSYTEGSFVTLSVKASDGYLISGYTINGKQTDITPAQNYSHIIAMREDTEIIFTTKRSNSAIIFSANPDSMGSVSAKTAEGGLNIPQDPYGTTISGAVTFTATPQSGYRLVSWKIEEHPNGFGAPSVDTTIPADSSRELTYTPYTLGCVVTANFAAIPGGAFTLTVNDTIFGSIELKDSAGMVIDVPASGTISMQDGASVTARAIPDEGFYFDRWTGDLVNAFTEETTFTVTENMSIGVEFYAELTSKLNFAVSTLEGKNGGTIKAMLGDIAVTSGMTVPLNAIVIYTAIPNEGNVFDDWEYISGFDSAITYPTDNPLELPSNYIGLVARFKEATVSSVDITLKNTGATEAYMNRGETGSFQLLSSVVGDPIDLVQGVTWSLSGENHSGTSITDEGLLIVNRNETSDKLTITATSTVDTSKTDTFEVTISTPNYIATVEGGTFKVGGSTVNGTANIPFKAGDIVELVPTVPDGMELDRWQVLQGNISISENGGKYTFVMPSEEVVVKAILREMQPVVTAVHVTPETISLNAGSELTFSVRLDGTNIKEHTADWYVTGAVDPYSADNTDGTRIDVNGKLSVSSNETAGTKLTITAISGGKSGTATVTISDIPDTTYSVTVNGGSGSGYYVANSTVTIAPLEQAGKEFDDFTIVSGINEIDLTVGANNVSTFNMPSEPVEITANYTDIEYSLWMGFDEGQLGLATQSDDAEVTFTINNGTPINGENTQSQANKIKTNYGDTVTMTVTITNPDKKPGDALLFWGTELSSNPAPQKSGIILQSTSGNSAEYTYDFTITGDMFFSLEVVDKIDVTEVRFYENFNDPDEFMQGVPLQQDKSFSNYKKIYSGDMEKAAAQFARVGYSVNSWNTMPNGTGTTVNYTDEYTGPLYLYAQWSGLTLVDQRLSFDNQEIGDKGIGDSFTQTVRNAETPVTYHSTNTAVATVDGKSGAVEIVGVGTANIVATAIQQDPYNGATASYSISVDNNSTELQDSITIFDADFHDLRQVIVNGRTMSISSKGALSGYPGYSFNGGVIGIVEEGSVKVTLYKEFLATLPENQYNIAISTAKGTSVIEGTPPAKSDNLTLIINDGGIGASGSGTYATGNMVTVDAGTKIGYTFRGWTINSGDITLSNSASSITQLIMLNDNVTLTANWSEGVTDDDTGGNTTGGGGGGGGGGTVDIEGEYSIIVRAEGEGTLTVLDEDGEQVESGDIIQGGEKLTIQATSEMYEPMIFVNGHEFKNGGEYAIYANTEIVARFSEEKALLGIPYYLNDEGAKVFLGFAADLNSDGVIEDEEYLAPQDTEILFMENPKEFTDISGHWAMQYIEFVTQRELFLGTSATEFSPDDAMTRAMFATVIGRLHERSYGEITQSDEEIFTDCDYSSYYGKYVAWAADSGVITGVGNNLFLPDEQISREQMATILFRYAELINALPQESDEQLTYSDKDNISDWATDAALFTQTTLIIKGKEDERFAPQDKATRAEVATIIERFIEYTLSE